MTNNTIPNVPRDLLERASNLAFQTQHYPLHEELRALLSAPSPAGVDGLKRYEVFPYLDDEVAEIDICESDDGSFVKYEDAQAIIDWLQSARAEYRELSIKYYDKLNEVLKERDQHAKRIGELEGLLRAESARVDFLDAYIVTADAPDTGKAAMLADSGTLRECIDTALSAGKEGE